MHPRPTPYRSLAYAMSVAACAMGVGAWAQNGYSAEALAAAAEDPHYAFLLSISEPSDARSAGAIAVTAEDLIPSPYVAGAGQRIDRRHRLPASAARGVDGGEALPLAEVVKLATAYRLRGDLPNTLKFYKRATEMSEDPAHLFFYIQACKDAGYEVLTEVLHDRYELLKAGRPVRRPAPVGERSARLTVAGAVTHSRFGNPIPGVEVRIADLVAEQEYVTKTEADGTYEIPGVVAGAEVLVRFSKANFASETMSMSIGERNRTVGVFPLNTQLDRLGDELAAKE